MNLFPFRSAAKKAAPTAPPAEERQPTLKELLGNLPADAREAAEIGAVKAELSEDPHYARKALHFFREKKNSHVDVIARAAALSGDPEMAIRILEEWHPDSAARIAKKHFGIERAIKVYEEAIQRRGFANDYEGLARLYEEQGNHAKAGEFFRSAIAGYIKEKNVRTAANLDREKGTGDVIGIYEKAAALEEEGRSKGFYYEQGAMIAKEEGKDEKARELYTKAYEAYLSQRSASGDLINLAKKLKDKQKLITAYERSGRPKKAAWLAEKEGELERAIEIYVRIKEPEKAAEVAFRSGDVLRAINFYEEAHNTVEAVRIAQKHGYPQKALDICEPKIAANEENGFSRSPEYYDIAMAAAAGMGDKEKMESFGRKAMLRFAALGEFSVSAAFAERLGEIDKTRVYLQLARLVALQPRAS